MNSELPRWMRELERHSQQRSLLLLTGNVRDRVFCPVGESEDGTQQWGTVSLQEALFIIFGDRLGGYEIVGHYDAVDGLVFRDEYETRGETAEMAKLFEPLKDPWIPKGAPWRPGPAPTQADWLNPLSCRIRAAMLNGEHPTALVVDYGSQLIAGPDTLSLGDRQAFLRLLKSAQEARHAKGEGGSRRNVLVLVCDRVADLPTWLYLNNPYSAVVEIAKPTRAERLQLLGALLDTPELQEKVGEIANLTDSMNVRDLEGIASLVLASESDSAAADIVGRYKYGVDASLWSEVDWRTLAAIEDRLSERVFGQAPAVRHVADVVRRARLHMSGAQHSGSGKPRGVLFFAGPTGVGKTELAKAVAEVVFGREDAYARFDMSEYGREHSDQRLLGAPPGYVGYEAGGELTNAVKENPFRVLLFDEIDKAHNSILDKFLQILEDGRMTDGQGETVYFSEAIIIFTSNAGIYREMPDGTKVCLVDPVALQTYEEVRVKVMEGIRYFFLNQLGRPELLNRFGNNIVVFNFLRAPVLESLLRKKLLPVVIKRVKKSWGIEVEFDEMVYKRLMEVGGADVSNGGRGMGNHVENMLVNPLSRVVFSAVEEIAVLRGEGDMLDDATVREALSGRRLRVKEIVSPEASTRAPADDSGGETWSYDIGYEWVERPSE